MNELLQLRKRLTSEYLLYKQGLIGKKEYCLRAKPIDEAIDKLEMAILQDTLALKGSSLPHSHRLKN